jgi:hypothetical protein
LNQVCLEGGVENKTNLNKRACRCQIFPTFFICFIWHMSDQIAATHQKVKSIEIKSADIKNAAFDAGRRDNITIIRDRL